LGAEHRERQLSARISVPLENQLQHAAHDQQADQENDGDYPKKYFHVGSGLKGIVRKAGTGSMRS
jgi:hypothetical protein